MLDSPLIRLMLRLLVLGIVFAACLAVFVLSSREQFTPANFPEAMPVVVATGTGAAVLQWAQVENSPVPLSLARDTSGCLDAFHCVGVTREAANIRQRIVGGDAWWHQQIAGSRIKAAMGFRLTLVMAFPAFLVAAVASQLLGWWLRRRARRTTA